MVKRPQVSKICAGRIAVAIFANFRVTRAICDCESRNGSCPQRDDWRSVALPLQSYRSTAAGVSSSAPPRCSLPDYFHLLLLCPTEKSPVATWRPPRGNAPFESPPSRFGTSLLHTPRLLTSSRLCPAGIPIHTTVITIPSCSSRPCWPATSRSRPTRR